MIDRRTLNRTLLARQLLLERADGDPVELVERLVGMQAQVPRDPYIGCWARLRDFDPHVLGAELEARRLVRMTTLRSTLHLVSARDALGLRPLLQPMLERAFRSTPFAKRLGGLDLEPVLARAAELVEGEPLTVAQLGAALAQQWPEHDPQALAYAARYALPLVQITPRGVWGKTLQPTVTTLNAWLDEAPGVDATVDELVLRYLRAFGPATAADVRTWSWLTDVRPVLERLPLRVDRDERGRELFDVEDGLVADASEPAPVRFLGQYDNVFLSHADRSRVIGDVAWDASFAHHGAFLCDGFLAGRWRLRETTLTVEVRARVTAGERREIRAEAGRLLELLAPGGRVEVEV